MTKADLKFKLTENFQTWGEKKVYQIQALKDFDGGDVKKGELGGFVESEKNLSQEGNCWVFKDGIVCDNAKIEDDASVYGGTVYENAKVGGSTILRGDCLIYGNAVIKDGSIEAGARIFGDAVIDLGEDEQGVFAGSYLDFNVDAKYPYFLLQVPSDWTGMPIAISKSGQICSYDFSGKIADFEKFIEEKGLEEKKKKAVLECIKSILQSF